MNQTTEPRRSSITTNGEEKSSRVEAVPANDFVLQDFSTFSMCPVVKSSAFLRVPAF
jgi:hypothetical protein